VNGALYSNVNVLDRNTEIMYFEIPS